MSEFVYDLVGHMRNNPAARATINKTMQEVERAHEAMRRGGPRDEVSAAFAKAVVDCGFNFGLVMPYYFYNFRDSAPMSLLDRPYMFAMTCLAPDSVTVLMSGRQVGKCADGETDISTDAGVMTLSELFDAGLPIPAG